ncbi:hypothetical protein [Caudoviricetes sp.]|nr:hypothetical protein [Caudoviricetes sp.]
MPRSQAICSKSRCAALGTMPLFCQRLTAAGSRLIALARRRTPPNDWMASCAGEIDVLFIGQWCHSINPLESLRFWPATTRSKKTLALLICVDVRSTHRTEKRFRILHRAMAPGLTEFAAMAVTTFWGRSERRPISPMPAPFNQRRRPWICTMFL